MSNAPPSITGASQENRDTEGQHPWTEHVDTMLRWRRFIVWGVGTSWIFLLLGGLLWPPTWLAEATIALPNIAFAEAKRAESSEARPALKPGIPVGTYKKVESALSDETLLTAAFEARPEQSYDIGKIRRNLRQIVSPITTGSRDDLVRADKEDNVAAVRLSYAGDSEAQTLGVINTLATLVREAVATRVARDRIETELLQSTASAGLALTTSLDLTSRNESLASLAKDLEKFMVAAPAPSAREVVSVTGVGYRYLPVPLQLVGVRAWQADNGHLIRQAQWSFKVESLKVSFYRRLERKLRSEGTRSDMVVVNDVPTIIDVELKAFVEQQKGPASEYLRAEVEALRDAVEAHRGATMFLQRPSLRTASRTPWLLVGMLASVGAVLLAALIGESWQRLHQAVLSSAAPLRQTAA